MATQNLRSPRLEFRGGGRACLLSAFLQSSQSPTRPAACHVKINRQSSQNPPFFQSTCSVFCLPAGPCLTARRPTFFRWFFRTYFSQLVMAHRQPRRPRPHQNGCAVNYNGVTYLDTWPQRSGNACTPRDRRGVFKLLARDPEDEKEIDNARR